MLVEHPHGRAYKETYIFQCVFVGPSPYSLQRKHIMMVWGEDPHDHIRCGKHPHTTAYNETYSSVCEGSTLMVQPRSESI